MNTVPTTPHNPFAAFEAPAAKPEPHPLREFFKSRGVTQAVLARFLGLGPKYLNAILCGHVPTPAHVEAKLKEAAEMARGM